MSNSFFPFDYYKIVYTVDLNFKFPRFVYWSFKPIGLIGWDICNVGILIHINSKRDFVVTLFHLLLWSPKVVLVWFLQR